MQLNHLVSAVQLHSHLLSLQLMTKVSNLQTKVDINRLNT